MINVTFLYPNNDNSRFDMDYYLTSHLQLSRNKFGTALKGLTVDRGLSGVQPGSSPAFYAVAHLLFDTLDEFYAALIPNIEEFKADALKYTDVEPVILVSERIA